MLCRRIKLTPAWRETGGKSALLLKGITSDKYSVSAREGCLCASELSAATQAKRFREQQRLGLASQEEFLLDAAALTKRKAETSGVAAWAEGDASDDEFEIDAPNQAKISYLSCTLLDMHPGRLSYVEHCCEPPVCNACRGRLLKARDDWSIICVEAAHAGLYVHPARCFPLPSATILHALPA